MPAPLPGTWKTAWSAPHSLPLAEEALAAVRGLVAAIPFAVDSLYCSKVNEACLQIGKIVADKFKLRVRNNANLEPGTWVSGKACAARNCAIALKPSPRHGKCPWTIIPPEGETLPDAVD